VTVEPPNATLTVGRSVVLTASVLSKLGPVENASVKWTSDAPNLVDVSGTGSTATATAKGVGTTTIHATSGDRSAQVSITVSNIPVATLSVSERDVTIAVGSTKQLSVTVKDAGGAALENRPIVWASLSSSVASVAATSGLVTGISLGTTKIVATIEGKSDTASVTVIPVPVAAVSITPSTPLDLTVGATTQLAATTKDAAGNTLTGRTITWASNGASVAQVSSAGLVSAVAVGSTTITATSEGKSASLAVKVSPVAPSYTVGTSSTPTNGGSTTGAGTYTAGTLVKVTANAASGFVFNFWSEGAAVVSSTASYEFTVNSNRALVANFATSSSGNCVITVQSSPAAGGSATGGGTVPCASPITLRATANAGYTFLNWTEGSTVLSTSNPYTFTPASGNHTYTANFTLAAPPNCVITVQSSPAAGGSATGGGTVQCGSGITLRATPNAGYVFVNWTEGSTVLSTTNPYTFNPTSGSHTYTGNFAPIPKFNLTVSLPSGNAGGKVVSTPAGINCVSPIGPVTCPAAFDSGTTVSLAATPNFGYQLTAWIGDCSGKVSPCSVTMNQSRQVTGIFSEISPPTGSSFTATLVGVKTAACPAGTAYTLSVNYFDGGGFFIIPPAGVVLQWMGSTLSPQTAINQTGTSTSGSLSFGVCVVFGSATSGTFTIFLKNGRALIDPGPPQSISVTKPAGAP